MKYPTRTLRLALQAAGLLVSACVSVSALAAAPAPVAANALPTGGQVAAGAATISQSGNTMTVNQTSQRAVVNWNTYNVGSNATVNYNQPNSQAVILNRVTSATPSQINGAINANGKVIISNANGVTFGKGAEVNAGSVVATTMNQTDAEFMAGSNTWSGNGTGKVVNHGKINVTDPNGYVALLAPEVRNQGIITAVMSANNAVVIGSGEKVTLNFSGTNLVGVTVDKAAVNALIKNKRAIEVAGGVIVIAAGSANQLMRSVIQNTGRISANSMVSNGGTIELVADTVVNNGTIAANANGATGNGGNVKIAANTINLGTNSDIQTNAKTHGNGGKISVISNLVTTIAGKLSAMGGSVSGNGGSIETSSKGSVSFDANLQVNTSAANGRYGQWIVDPLVLNIDANAAALISTALQSTNVVLNATAATCGGTFGACSQSSLPTVNFLAGADIYSNNVATVLRVLAVGGLVNVNNNINVGQVYIEADTINVNGNIGTTGGANSNILLLGAQINILGNLGSNGQSTSNGNGTSTIGGNRRRQGFDSGLNSDNSIYTTNGGNIVIAATGDITIGSNATITANGLSGGKVTIVSQLGTVTNSGVVDSVGTASQGGQVTIAGQVATILNSALMSVDGAGQGGVLQIGIAQNIGSGSILAPPAIGPPSSQYAGLISNINIVSQAVSSDSKTGLSANGASGSQALTGEITVQAVGTVEVLGSQIQANNGTITIGRDGYKTGNLAQGTDVSGAILTARFVETSGQDLLTNGTVVRASEWLLDPTNVTIGTTSTTGTLNGDLANAGATNIKATDIQAAINAGTSVNIVASGAITQSAALAFNITGTGLTPTLTFDNRTGSKQSISLGVISDTSSGAGSGVNLAVYSAGGGVPLSGAITVKGTLTIDNTYQVGGTTSGYINASNITTLGQATPLAIRNAISAGGDITLNYATLNVYMAGETSFGTTVSLWVGSALSSTNGSIRINNLAYMDAAHMTVQGGVWIGNTITANSGVVSIVANEYGGNGGTWSIWFLPGTAAAKISAQQVSLVGYDSISTYGMTLGTTGLNVLTIVAGHTFTADDPYAIYVSETTNGLNDSTRNRGLWLQGDIVSNANGGSISFNSNSLIQSSGTIQVAANTSGLESAVSFNTTMGNNLAYVSRSGTFTVAGGSTSPVDFSIVTNGAQITEGSAISVPGYINLDMTNGGVVAASGSTTATGITVSGNLAASNLANAANGINIAGLSTTGAAVALGASTLTNGVGNINISGFESAAGAAASITSTGVITQNANGGNITFASNNSISQTGALTVVANTSGAASAITYDTTAGNSSSSITSGALNVTGTSTSSIDYLVKTSGAPITVGAISVPGTITLDNTWRNGASGGINSTNASTYATTSSGITLNGALTASNISNATNGILINSVANSAGLTYGANLRQAMTATKGAVSVTGINVGTSYGIYLLGNVTATNGAINLYGSAINAGSGYGINIANSTQYVSAKTDINIAGYASGTTGYGVYEGGLMLAGGNLTVGGYGGSGGIWFGNPGVTYGAGNIIFENANVSATGVAGLAAGYATATGGNAHGVAISSTTTASTVNTGPNTGSFAGLVAGGTLNISGQNTQASGTGGYGVWLSGTGNYQGTSVTISGKNAGNTALSAINTAAGAIKATTGAVSITGITTSTGAATPVINFADTINAATGVSIIGTGTTQATVVSDSASVTNAAGDIVVTGNNAAGGANTGISMSGAINQNANGGNITFTSNNKISQTGAVTVAANTSGTASSITYDTTTGTSASTITSGALTLTGGVSASNTAINYIEKAAGASIAATAISVPGYINLDNTYSSGVSGGISTTNAATLATSAVGVSVGGALISGAYATGNNGNGIQVNGVSSGGYGTSLLSTLTAATGSIWVSGQSTGSWGLTANGGNITATNAGITLIGISKTSAATTNMNGVYVGSTTNLYATNATSGNINIYGTVYGAGNANDTTGAVWFNGVSGGNYVIAGNGLNISGYAAGKNDGVVIGYAFPVLLKTGGNMTLSSYSAANVTGYKSMYLNGSPLSSAGSLTMEGSVLGTVNGIANVSQGVLGTAAYIGGGPGDAAIYTNPTISVTYLGTAYSQIASISNIWIAGYASYVTSGAGNYGVFMKAPIKSTSGNITIIGEGGGNQSGTYGAGIFLFSNVVASTGSITLQGTNYSSVADDGCGVCFAAQSSAMTIDAYTTLDISGVTSSNTVAASAAVGLNVVYGAYGLLLKSGSDMTLSGSSTNNSGAIYSQTGVVMSSGGNLTMQGATTQTLTDANGGSGSSIPTVAVGVANTSATSANGTGTYGGVYLPSPTSVTYGGTTYTNIAAAGSISISGTASSTAVGVSIAEPISSVGSTTIVGNSTSSKAVDIIGTAITSGAGITITGTASNATTVVSDTGSLTNSGGTNSNIVVTGNDAAAGANTGISMTGTITQNANGGDIKFISNNSINQTNTVSIAANNSGSDSIILYDTSTGNRNSTINGGAVTFNAGYGTGSSNYINYSNIASGAKLIVNSALNVPGSITFDNTYLNGVQGGITSANAWNLGTVSAGGGVPVTANLTAAHGIYIRGVVGASSSSAAQTTDAVSIYNATANSTVSLTTTGSFNSGEDAINIVGITPQFAAVTGTTAGNAIHIYGASGTANVAINNNSTGGGNTNLVAYTGRYNDVVSITNASTAGAIELSAIGPVADIVTVAGTTFTQNSNSGVYIATSNNGNVTPPKIINLGTGSVVVAAGAYLPVGTVSTGTCTATACGQITGLSGNTITSANGRVYLYAGSPGTTAGTTTTQTSLAYLDSTLGTLTLGNTVFGQAYETGNVPSTAIPDQQINTANVPLGSAPVIQFRIQPSYQLITSANMTKVYGTADPSVATNMVSTSGTLEYFINNTLIKNSANNPGFAVVGGVEMAVVNVNGLTFNFNLNSLLNTVTGTRAAGEQVAASPYNYTLTTSTGIALTHGLQVTAGTTTTAPLNLAITPAPLTVTDAGATVDYNGTATYQNVVSGAGFTLTGLVTSINGVATGDAVSSVTQTIRTGSTIGSGTTITGSTTPSLTTLVPVNTTYNAVPSGATGSNLSNYTISYVGNTYTVTKPTIIVTALADTKVYGATTSAQGVVYGLTGNTQTSATNLLGYSLSGAVLPAGVSVTGVTLTLAQSAATAGVGSYAITPSLLAASGSLSNYNISYVNGALTVTAAPLTVSTNASSVYGSGATVNTPVVSGLQNSDTVSASAIAAIASLNAKTVGTYGNAVTTTGVTFGTGSASNYSISYLPGTLTVTPETLTITANPVTTNYGTPVSLGSSAFTTSGLVTTNGLNDAVTGVSLQYNGGAIVPGTVNAGTATGTIVVSNASGSGLSNYTINYVAGDLTVNAAPITITANNVVTTYGTVVTPTAYTITSGQLYNGNTISGVTLGYVGTSSVSSGTPNVGTYTGVNGIQPSAAVFSNGSPSNYAITYANGSLTVNKATASISATKVYDGSATFTAGSVGTFTVLGVNGEVLAVTGSGSANSTDVISANTFQSLGTIALANGPNGALASNYQMPSVTTVSITPKPLTASISTTITKVYDTTTTATLVAGDNTLTPSGTTTTSGSYTLNGFVSGQGAVITKTAGLYNSANASANTMSVDKATNVSTTLLATDYTGLAGTSLSNYILPTSVTGTGVINPAPITVNADPVSIFAGQTPVYTSTVTGLLGGQTVPVTYSVTNNANPPVAQDPTAPTQSGTITPAVTASAVSMNYTATPVTAPLTVASYQDMVFTGYTTTKVYGQVDSSSNLATVGAPTVSYCATTLGSCVGHILSFGLTVPTSGNIWTATDTASGASYTFAMSVPVVSSNFSSGNFLNAGAYTTTPGTATGTPGSLTVGTKYYNTGKLIVTPLSVTPTNNTAPTKQYDATTTMTTPISLAVTALDRDSLSATGTGAYNSKNAGTSLGYTISNIALTGTDAANYVLSTTLLSGNNGVITPAELTVSGLVANNKVYDTTTAATISSTSQSLSGILGSDQVSISSTGNYVGTFASKNVNAVGSPIAVTAGTTVVGGLNTMTGVTLTGNDAGNYYVRGPSSTLSANITQAPVTISGTRVYNGTLTFAPSALTVSGVGGETLVFASGSGSANSANVGVANTLSSLGTLALGNGTGSLVGLASNYTLTNPTISTISITPATIVVSGTDALKVYDATTAMPSSNVTSVSAIPTPTLVGGTLYTNDSNGSVQDSLSGGNFAYTNANAGTGKTVTVSGVLVNDGNNGDNYTVSYVNNTTSTISKAPVTINGTSTYNGTNTTGNLTVSGVAGQTLNIVGGTATMSSINAGTNAISGLAGGTLATGGSNPGDVSNYTLTGAILGNVVVSPAPITVSATNAVKTYDNSLLATGSAMTQTPTAVLVGGTLYNSDALSGGAFAYTTPTAATGSKVVTVGGVSILNNGSDISGNYAITYVNNTTSTINQATLTVSGLSVTSRDYNATNVATLTGTPVLNGVIGGTTVNLSGTANAGTFSTVNVGTGLAVTPDLSGYSLSGTDAANYVLTGVTAPLTGAITPKALSATIINDPTMVYNATTLNSALVSGNYQLTGFVNSENATVSQPLGNYNSADVASANTITASLLPSSFTANSGTLLSNYILPTSATGAGHITPAPITVTAGNVVTFVGVAPTLTNIITVSGLQGSDTLANALATSSVSNNAPSSGAGTYVGALVPTATANSNYTISRYVPGDLTIAAAGQLILSVGSGSNTVVYGTYNMGNAAQAGDAAQGNVTGTYCTNCAAGVTNPNYVTLTIAAPTTGSNLWTASDNIAVGTPSQGVYNFTVTPTIPAGSYSTGGYLKVGAYTLTPGNVSTVTGYSTNYDTTKPVIYNAGTLTVTPLTLTFSSGPTTTYNGTTQIVDAAITPSNKLTGDVLQVAANGTLTSPNASAGNAIYTLTGAALTGADAANYVFSTSATGASGANATVLQAPLTISVSNAVKTYNNATSTSDSAVTTAPTPVVVSGTLYTNTQTGVADTLNSVATVYTDANAGNGNKTLTVTGAVINNGVVTATGNYTITYVNNTTSTITPAPLTVSGLTAANKTYDSTTAAVVSGTPVLAGSLYGQTVAVLGSVTSGDFATANAGNAIDVTPDLGTLSLSNPNFTISGVTTPLSANITPAPLTISGLTASSKVYNASTAAALTGTPVLAGNTFGQSVVLSGTAATGVFTSPNAAQNIAVTPTLSGLSLDNNNFTISGVTTPLNADITPKSLTAAIIGSPTMVYNGTTTNSGLTSANYSLSGFVAGQGATVNQAVGNYNSANVADATSITAQLSGSNLTASSGTLLSNYILPTSALGAGTITPAPLTMTADNATTFIGVAPTLTYTLSGLKGSDTAAVLNSAQITNNAPANPGSGTYVGVLEPSATVPSGNYTLTTVNGNLTVASNFQLVIGAGNNSQIYGTLGATNQNTAVTGVTAKYCTNCATGVTTPTYVNLVVSGSGSSWTAADTYSGNTATYGFTVLPVIPANAFSVGGAGTSAGNYINVGNYVIQPSGVTTTSGTPNYNTALPVIYNVGTLTVTPFIINNSTAPISSSITQQYNGSTNINNVPVSLAGLPAGAALSVAGSGSLVSPNAGAQAYTLNNLSLSGADAANFAFSGPLNGTATITPAPITVTASNAVKVYDATTATTGGSLTPEAVLLSGTLYTNSVSGLTDTLGGISTVYTNANAGAGNKILTVSGAAINNGSNDATGNYTITYVNNTTSTITPAPLTVSGLTAANKTYDATTAALISGTPVLAGSLYGQTVAVTGAVTNGNFASTNAGNGIAVTADLMGLTLNNSNFMISGVTTPLSANITPAPLTISGLTASNKPYDTTMAAALTGTPVLAGNTFGQNVTLTGSATAGTFASPNAATGITVTPTLSGLSLNNTNFTISGVTNSLTANITPLQLTATLVDTVAGSVPLTMQYTGVTDFGGLTAANYHLTGFIGGQDATVNQAVGNYNSANVLNATTMTAQLSPANFTAANGTLLSNYVLPTSATGAATITPTPLTVTANNASTFIGQAPVTGYTVAGLKGADTLVDALPAGVLITNNAPANAGAGSYVGVLVPTATTSGNYTLTTVNGNLSIASNFQLVIGAGNNSQIYGTLGATNQNTAVTGVTAKYCTNCATGVTTPTYVNLVVSGSGSSWTAADTYSGNTATYGFTVLPVIPSNAYSTGSTVTTGNYIKVGTYTIQPSAVTTISGTPNYDTTLPVIYNTGTLTVTPFLINANTTGLVNGASGSSISRPYDGTTNVNNMAVSLSGLPAGTVLSATGSGALANPNAGAQTYTLNNLILSGADAANFAFDGPLMGTATITPLQLTAAIIGSPTMVYNGTTTNSGLTSANYSLSGFVAGQGATVNQAVGNYNSANVADATSITAQLNGSNLTPNPGTLLSNYILPTSASGAGTITPAPLTMTADNATTFIGVALTLTYTLSGLKGADTAAVLNSAQITNNAPANPGSGTYVGVLEPSATVPSGNYTLTTVNGNLTVASNFQLVIGAGNNSQIYGTLGATNQNTAVTGVTAKYCTNCATGVTTPTYVNLVVSGSGSSWTAADTYSGNTATYGFTVLPVIPANAFSVGGAGTSAGNYINVGNYVIQPSGVTTTSGTPNYNTALPVIYNTGTLTVTPFIINNSTAPISSSITQQYNGSTNINNVPVSLAGLPAGAALSVAGSGSLVSPNAGAQAYTLNNLSLSGADAANFAFSGPLNGTATITPAPITVTASNAVKVYDATTGFTGASLLPGAVLVNGTLYSQNGVQDRLTGGTFAYADANAGSGTKTVTVAAVDVKNGNTTISGNYTITYVNNTTSTITPAPLTISGLTAEGKQYNATSDAVLGGSAYITGNMYGQSVSLLGSVTSGTFASANAANGIDVVANLNNLTLSNSNFEIVGVSTPLSANITPAPLTISGLSVSGKTYDATTGATITGTPTLSGNLFGQAVNLSGIVNSGSFASANAGMGIAVTPTLSDLALNNPNFMIVGPTTPLTGDIAKATITVNGTMSYNGSTIVPTSGLIVSGINGQTLNLAAGTGTVAGVGPGTVNLVALNGLVLVDGTGLASNYTIVNPTMGTVVISGSAPQPAPINNQINYQVVSQVNTYGTNAIDSAGVRLPAAGFWSDIGSGSSSSQGSVTLVGSGTGQGEVTLVFVDETAARDNRSGSMIRLSQLDTSLREVKVLTQSAPENFGYDLTDHVIEGASETDGDLHYEATLIDGSPLPGWLRFNPDTRAITADMVPGGSLPIQIKVLGKRNGNLLTESFLQLDKAID